MKSVSVVQVFVQCLLLSGCPSMKLLLRGFLFPIINTTFIRTKYSRLFTNRSAFLSSSYPKTQILVILSKNKLITVMVRRRFLRITKILKLFHAEEAPVDIPPDFVRNVGQVCNVKHK